MTIRPRAAAIILNEKKELLLLRQKHPKTGFEWWTLPGGGIEAGENVIQTIRREVREECCIDCKPLKLLYVSESVDDKMQVHHLGMFFLAEIEKEAQIKMGYDPEVKEQYIVGCEFVSKEKLEQSGIPIYPELFSKQFWIDLRGGFNQYEIYYTDNKM